MIKVRGLFLLDQVFEDADVFGLRYLDSKRLIQLVTENKAVEGEKLRGVGHYSGLKDDAKENVVATYQGALLPRCVGRRPKDHQQRVRTTSCWVSMAYHYLVAAWKQDRR